MEKKIIDILKKARDASKTMFKLSTNTKVEILEAISNHLLENTKRIILENNKDIVEAKENGLSNAMIDRLLLNEERITSLASDVIKLSKLDDPIGNVLEEIKRPNGLNIQKICVPLGVIGIIYESRPNVTVDLAVMCIKTNNVCVLKGGKEAKYTNRILVKIINDAIASITKQECVFLVEVENRSQVEILLKAKEYIDVIIPRGSANLINYVVNNSIVPVIETGAGICHLYVDSEANLDMAIEIACNGKIQRPSVCNALETILVHKDIAKQFLVNMQAAFNGKVEIYGDSKVCEYIDAKLATEKNYATEYGDYICNCKVVDSIEEAIEHIYTYSTKHSEVIVSQNTETCELFLNTVDSSCVYANASTRFSDGGEFGFGVEVGISTQKLHARGPMGLREITSTKYVIRGNGQIR